MNLDRQWLRTLWSFVEQEIPSSSREGRLVARIRPTSGKRYRDIEAADMDGLLWQVRSSDTVTHLEMNLSGHIGPEVRQIKLVLGAVAEGETRGNNVIWVAGCADVLTEMFGKARCASRTRIVRSAAGAIAFMLAVVSVSAWRTGSPFHLQGLGGTLAVAAAAVPWRRPPQVRLSLGNRQPFDLEVALRLTTGLVGVLSLVLQAVKLFLSK